MARCPLVIFAALALSAWASDSPPPATSQYQPDPALIAAVKADREAVTNAYVLCLVRAAKRLDDHKSDPATIAQAMLSACAKEWDDEMKVYSRGPDREIVERKAKEGRLGTAIQIVLTNRKAAAACLALSGRNAASAPSIARTAGSSRG